MSHLHERTEKICLNCSASLYGRYCHMCGQENVEPRESVGHLVRHFFEDITHFDGKFFSTLKLLITKPGFLSAEYLAGRRASYLNPVRMYMFISFIFFFVFFTFQRKSELINTVKQPKADTRYGAITVNNGDASPINITVDSSHSNRKGSIDLPTVAQYEQEQDSLPPGKRDNALKHYFLRRILIATNAAVSGDKKFTEKVTEKFLHFLPQMFFVLLPIFALFLNLLYMRRRKQYNYVAHAIFTIHFYCLVFIGWLCMHLLSMIPVIGLIADLLLFIAICVYLYIAMRRFYKQGGFKTFVKYILLNSFLLVLFAVLTIIYVSTAMISSA